MKADYLTYRKAASISGLGLGLQAVLGVALLLYAKYTGGGHAATTGAIVIGIGLLVWFALLVLFDQHRRERLEAMEAETLAASDSIAASAFEASGEETRMAAARLASVRKWFIPGMSLLVAFLLIGVGLSRFGSAKALLNHDLFKDPSQSGWGIAIALGVAFVGFVFARFVSGMSNQKEWSALRAGASQAVGAALIGLAIAVALFVRLAGGPDWPLRWLPVVLTVAMVVGGAEILLNFVLDIYRPRTHGEAHRPSFDSRILGFVAAPDKIAESVGEAISYQFGVDVTSSWFYQLLSRSIMLLVLFAVVVVWGLTSLVVVQPHQRAMILTNGAIDRAEVGPGLHLKWPWPISSVVTPEHTQQVARGKTRRVRTTTGVQVMHLGTNPPDAGSDPIVWGKQHATEERFLLVQPGTGAGDDEADENEVGALSLIATEVPVHYIVSDVELYELLAAPGQQRRMLESIGRRLVFRHLSMLSVDEVLATERGELAEQLHAELVRGFAALNENRGAGIELLFVGAAGVHPPRDVAPNFERVVQARQVRESKIEQAQTEQIRTLTGAAGSVELADDIVAQLAAVEDARLKGEDLAELELQVQKLLESAGGEAGEQLLSASGRRWTRHMGERAKASLFAGQLVAHDAAPSLYRSRIYFDAWLDAIKDARVYLTADGVHLNTTIELQDRQAGRDVFSTGADEPAP